MLEAERTEHLRVAVEAVRSRGKADHRCSRGQGAGRADLRILNDRAAGDVDAHLAGGEEIEVRRRFPALDMLAAAVQVIAERAGEPKIIEMRADPARRARRSDR